jgi:Tol biopolymer transport system component
MKRSTLALLLFTCACGGQQASDGGSPLDAFQSDAIPQADAERSDLGVSDTAALDASFDSGVDDAGTDATPTDANDDAAALDAVPIDGGVLDSGTTDATSSFCSAPQTSFAGHYTGVATIHVYWGEVGDPSHPVCINHNTTSTASAVLDIVEWPSYQVAISFPGYTGAPQQIALDPTFSAWLPSGSGTGIIAQWPCGAYPYADWHPGTISIDSRTGSAAVNITCSWSHLDACHFPINAETDYTMTLPRRCVSGETTCIRDSRVTCDANGVVTSSVPCGAPCGPCAPPFPEACGPADAPYCANLMSDRFNCGSCDHACAAGEFCTGGTCVASCPTGQSACPLEFASYCADLTSDSSDCGSCGHACPLAQICEASACVCPASRPDVCGTGSGLYCAKLAADMNNCGLCGRVCTANEYCANGSCTPCASGLTACGNPTTSYCADLTTDHDNCGACFRSCSAGSICGARVCTSCGQDIWYCDAACHDFEAEASNCGGCGVSCGTGACYAGACYPAAPALVDVTVGLGGVPADNGSERPVISSDGRFVAFESSATNLVANDANNSPDVFFYDMQAGRTALLSVATNGAPGNAWSGLTAMSADGSIVAFTSGASTLVPGDSNGVSDVFVHDVGTGVTALASLGMGGAPANGPSFGISLSADGRYVAFASSASNLVPNDTNRDQDIFVLDNQTGTLVRANVSSNGAQAAGASTPRISSNGRFVAFQSGGADLVPGDTNAASDVFVHDLQSGATTRVSVASDGAQGNANSPSFAVSDDASAISADGRFIAFSSYSTNLVAGVTSPRSNVYVHDMQTGATALASAAASGTPGDGDSAAADISADGRFVTFASSATNLVSGDTNGAWDVFVHDMTTGATARLSGGHTDTFQARISADGRWVTFASDATNLIRSSDREVFVVRNPLAP